MAISDRSTNICQMTKLPLVNVISASPRESAGDESRHPDSKAQTR